MKVYNVVILKIVSNSLSFLSKDYPLKKIKLINLVKRKISKLS